MFHLSLLSIQPFAQEKSNVCIEQFFLSGQIIGIPAFGIFVLFKLFHIRASFLNKLYVVKHTYLVEKYIFELLFRNALYILIVLLYFRVCNIDIIYFKGMVFVGFA